RLHPPSTPFGRRDENAIAESLAHTSMETPMNVRLAVIAGVVSYSLVAANAVSAQTSESKAAPDSSGRWSLLVPSGAIVPTGAQRHAIKRGNVTAIQLAF